jgi:hypothetical protein
MLVMDRSGWILRYKDIEREGGGEREREIEIQPN